MRSTPPNPGALRPPPPGSSRIPRPIRHGKRPRRESVTGSLPKRRRFHSPKRNDPCSPPMFQSVPRNRLPRRNCRPPRQLSLPLWRQLLRLYRLSSLRLLPLPLRHSMQLHFACLLPRLDCLFPRPRPLVMPVCRFVSTRFPSVFADSSMKISFHLNFTPSFHADSRTARLLQT